MDLLANIPPLLCFKKAGSHWRDTLNGVSRQFYSPTAVVLLRSDIRYASFVANKISLKP